MDGAGEALWEGVLDVVGVVDAPLLREVAGVPEIEGVTEGSDDDDLDAVLDLEADLEDGRDLVGVLEPLTEMVALTDSVGDALAERDMDPEAEEVIDGDTPTSTATGGCWPTIRETRRSAGAEPWSRTAA